MAKDSGLVESGNIDLHNRPVVKNKDGTISTVRSISVNFGDGLETVIPTVSDDGKILSDADAMALFLSTGKHLGKFKDVPSATRYSKQLHRDQEKEYSK
jgi:hypothetical protein